MKETLSEILQDARQRALSLDAPYAGCLLPCEAHRLLHMAPGARLVDVRTRAEWDFAGFVPGSILIEWQHYPHWNLNQNFYVELRQQASPESLIFFLCRNGQRSHLAAIAATRAGYSQCYNILEGFEGERDAVTGQRRVNGWKNADLPWIQN